jgi:hypothetical protein
VKCSNPMRYNIVWPGKLKLTVPTSIWPITFIYADDRSSIFLLPACILPKTVSPASCIFINSSWCAEVHICAHNRKKAWEQILPLTFYLHIHSANILGGFFSFIRQIMSKTLEMFVTVTVFRILQTWRQIQYFGAKMFAVYATWNSTKQC